MADSTTPPSIDLAALSGGAASVGVACSGGADSIALLHAAVQAALADGVHTVVALHVHHGLLPEADAWMSQLEATCSGWVQRGWPVVFRGVRLSGQPQVGESVEGWARDERYRALATLACEAGCHTVLLAQHCRDQAETFVMQALCGGGTAALAAMPAQRLQHGVRWRRPWLQASRHAIDAYVARHGLAAVLDPSNDDLRFVRSRVRRLAMPALRDVFPGSDVDRALARAAQHQGDVLACLRLWLEDTLGQVVAENGVADRGGELLVARWVVFEAGPRRELLREWFRRCTDAVMPVGLLQEVEKTLLHGTSACHWVWRPRRGVGDGAESGIAKRGGELWLHRGRLSWHEGFSTAPLHTAVSLRNDLVPGQRWPLAIDRPGLHRLPGGWGWLDLVPADRDGLTLAQLDGAHLRRREGGERFCLGAGRPARDLKKQFQDQGVPAWARFGPLIWREEVLLCVPGLGVEWAVRAPAGLPQWVPVWRPDLPG